MNDAVLAEQHVLVVQRPEPNSRRLKPVAGDALVERAQNRVQFVQSVFE